jgi:hypothetical protein
MFRLPDFLTGENVKCNSLKLLQTWQPLYYKNEEKLLERLDQAILDVINNPQKAQKTARIGTLIWQTL